nr:immunoglobulin heavy chain junction region [Mus musculus]
SISVQEERTTVVATSMLW